jgi:hypothetical protein
VPAPKVAGEFFVSSQRNDQAFFLIGDGSFRESHNRPVGIRWLVWLSVASFNLRFAAFSPF